MAKSLDPLDRLLGFFMGSHTVKDHDVKEDTSFETTSNEFLNFAILDSQTNDVRSRVNAFSNVKRAIECRMDELLYYLCLHVKSNDEHWDFPTKVDVLGTLDVITPDILKKFNHKRNDLEHRYIRPSQDDVQDALGVARLFLAYTDRFYNRGCSICRFSGEDWNIQIDRKNKSIDIDTYGDKFVVKIDHDDRWLGFAKSIRQYFVDY